MTFMETNYGAPASHAMSEASMSDRGINHHELAARNLQPDEFGSGFSQTPTGQTVHVLPGGVPSAYGTSHPLDIALGHVRRLSGFAEQAKGKGKTALEQTHELLHGST